MVMVATMSWPAQFRYDLANPDMIRSRIFVVESTNGPLYAPLGGSLRLSSRTIPYYSNVICLEGSSYSGADVTPGDWQTTQSTMTIACVASHDFRPAVQRGQLVQVRMGFVGYALADYATIHLGHVQNVRQSDGMWFIEIRGAVASLTSRYSDEDDKAFLFWDFPNDVDIDADYTAGDATLEIDSTATFEKETGGGTLYGVAVDGDSGPFILTATGTGTSPTRLTGVSSTSILPPSEENDTAAGTNNAHGMWLVRDHPVDVFRKITASTGTGGNGSYDTLPSSWGLAIPDVWLDHPDMDRVRQMCLPASGDTTWTVAGTERVDDGLAFLQSMLAGGGMFVTERQGQLTVRHGHVPSTDPFDLFHIDERDIISIDSYDTYTPTRPAEVYGLILQMSGDIELTTEPIKSRPVVNSLILYADHITDNRSGWGTEILARVAPWYHRVAEKVVITVAGWRLAQMAPGSQCTISCRLLSPRDQDTLTARWFVGSCVPNWFGSTCKITAYLLPLLEDSP